jgi:molybdenum cofactor biosynthesis enzyme
MGSIGQGVAVEAPCAAGVEMVAEQLLETIASLTLTDMLHSVEKNLFLSKLANYQTVNIK